MFLNAHNPDPTYQSQDALSSVRSPNNKWGHGISRQAMTTNPALRLMVESNHLVIFRISLTFIEKCSIFLKDEYVCRLLFDNTSIA